MEIWGGQYLCGGHNLFPLVEIGLTGLPKSGYPQGRQACNAWLMCVCSGKCKSSRARLARWRPSAGGGGVRTYVRTSLAY